nr:MAG TPA: AAA domain protein [Caudoviricetes sp.]
MSEFQGIIEKVNISKFRKFIDLEIKCGKKLTVIAGQNGTQKTTLLGLLAHPFSMSKKNPDDENIASTAEDEQVKDFSEAKTIQGHTFQSKFASKFKFDNAKERAKEHEYSLYMYDKSIGNNGIFTLESIMRDKKSQKLRLWKKGARKAGDGYMHYPVIYLSLKRVSPIGEEQKISNNTVNLTNEEQNFLKSNYDEILLLPPEEYETNELKSSNKSTLVSHPSTYSALTVSAGQDNIGSILTAVLSFKRLKEEFPSEYKGGLLFIDEIESTLYPASQENLVRKLFKYAKDFQLQIFCTTHSPSIINIAMKDEYKNDCAFNYLKSFGLSKIIVDEKATPEQIYAHLSLTPIIPPSSPEKIRVYTEDEEARLFLRALLPTKYIRLLNIVKVNIGANELVGLKNRKIKEFTNNLIVLDGDQTTRARNIINLPGQYGPDKLLHEFLKNLPTDDPFWPDVETTGAYSYQVCFRTHHEPPSTTEGEQRKFYKKWFKEQCDNHWWDRNNLKAFKYWISQNQAVAEDFKNAFIKTYNLLAKKNNLPLIQ